MVKVCNEHIKVLERGTTYEIVSERNCNICNLFLLDDKLFIYVMSKVIDKEFDKIQDEKFIEQERKEKKRVIGKYKPSRHSQ